jgi:hypothetical protein
MSIKVWGMIGASVSAILFQFIKYQFGGGWAIGFLVFLIVAWIALCLLEKRQTARLKIQISKLGPAQREHFVRELDPEVQADLRKLEKSKTKGD